MGFILRSLFWLTLASIIVPAQARFGYDGNAEGGRESSLSEQVHDTASAVWGFTTQVAKTCDTNPALCDAGQNLASTVANTGASLLREAQARISSAANEGASPGENAHTADATHAQQHKKFQERY